MTHTVRPSWQAQRIRRLQNQLTHRGLTVDLKNTDDTIAKLQAYIADCEKLVDEERYFTDREGNKRPNSGADGNIIAKHMNNMRPAIALLHEALAKRESAGTDLEDPETEARTAEELRRRGWYCSRENPVTRVIRALEGYPEAREAVVRALGGVDGKEGG